MAPRLFRWNSRPAPIDGPPAAQNTMATDDFDVPALAAYLHLAPQQVMRLADRGKIPGRKVSGRWRFARAEVHHWLERRIGLADEAELVDVEGVLRRDEDGLHARPATIAEQLLPEAIAVPLAAKTRDSVIRAMTALAAGTGMLWDAEKMADAVRAREEMHSTALENGVALLHPRRPLPSILGQAFLAMGCTCSGVPFGGGFGNLTDVFFLVCSLDDRGHLQTLARLSRILAAPGFLDALRQASDPSTAHRLTAQTERSLKA